MRLIYVAGPYHASTYSGVEDNIREAERVSMELIARGWAVLTPHKNTAHYEIYGNVADDWDHDFWMDMDFEILRRCDAIFMMKDWKKSKGTKMEIKLAKKLKIPVFYERIRYPSPGSVSVRV